MISRSDIIEAIRMQGERIKKVRDTGVICYLSFSAIAGLCTNYFGYTPVWKKYFAVSDANG